MTEGGLTSWVKYPPIDSFGEGTQSELIAVMVFATPATAAWPKHVCKIISLERRATFGGGFEGFNGKRHGILVP